MPIVSILESSDPHELADLLIAHWDALKQARDDADAADKEHRKATQRPDVPPEVVQAKALLSEAAKAGIQRAEEDYEHIRTRFNEVVNPQPTIVIGDGA